MLKILLGRSGTGKSEQLLRTITQEGRSRPQVLIVPEQHSHDTERALCALGGNGVSLSAEVLSFTRLASRVFSVAGGLAQPTLDSGGRVLLMDAALNGVRDQLRVYARPSRKPSFLTQLLATVDECKAAGITPERLGEAAAAAEGETGDRFYDLSLICGAYDALCEVRGADPRDRLTKLAHALDRCPWGEGKDFYLDSFTDLTAQEREVLRRLLSQAHGVTVALTCDGLNGTEEENDVFAPARRTVNQLIALAKETGTGLEVKTLTEPALRRAEGLALLEAHLFDPVLPVLGERWQGVFLYRGLTPYTEVERCAAELVRLCREEGYRYRELAVTARSMAVYGPLIDQIFPRYGIPVFLSAMDNVTQKPILTLVTAALDTVAGEYQYEDVFRYLKTGLTDLTPDEVDRLENYALTWDLQGSAWTQQKDWDRHPQGYSQEWTQEDRDQVAELDGLRRRVVRPLEGLRRTGDRTAGGLTLALYRFLEEIGLALRLTQRAQELRERGETALAAEYEQLWGILCAGLEQCADLLGDTPMEWEEFARLFRLVLSQYQVGAIPVSLDRVTAGEMPRLAHKRCRVVYLLGCDDGSLPAAAPSPGLLADEDRELLARMGMETAPRLDQKLWRELTIVYETCALPTERLILSRSAVDLAGQETRPSFLERKVRTLFPDLPLVREEELPQDFRLTAPRPALSLAGRDPQVGESLKALADYAPLVERMERGKKLDRGHLSRRAVKALFHDPVGMSASQMDKCKSCHFAYFMRYGMRARPRRPVGFQAPEYGTFVHYVLEQVLKQRKGKEVPTRQQVSQVVARYVEEKLGGLERETPRFRYLFDRLKSTVYAVVENVCQELAGAEFQPIAFELGFGKGKDLPPLKLTADGVALSITGFVDRVDGFEKDGRLYLRVVDYKTGRKSFDLTDVWNGLGLQMLLYLFALKEEGKDLFGKEISPAGVLYLPARDVAIQGSRTMSEEERQKLVDRELKRSGILLEEEDIIAAMEQGQDGFRFLPLRVLKSGQITGEALVNAERLGRLEKHTKQVLAQIASELAAGVVAADPYWQGPQKNACVFCEYPAACQYRDGVGGDHRRWLPKVPAKEFWKRLEDEEKEGTDRAGTVD